MQTCAASRRARVRAPPSPSRCARDAVASSAASRARSGEGSNRRVPAGKSSSAPAAASRVRTRSAVSVGMPWSAAAWMTCARSRLPSRRVITRATPAMPVSATARRESIPICSVLRSRHTGSSPGFSAGLTILSVTGDTDSPDIAAALGMAQVPACLRHGPGPAAWPGSPRPRGTAGVLRPGRGPRAPERHGEQPLAPLRAVRLPSPEATCGLEPGDSCFGEARPGAEDGQYMLVDGDVDNMGSGRSVAVDSAETFL